MRMLAMWVKGTILHRFGSLVGAMVGVALTVAFISLLGMFLTVTNSQMTARAVKDVPVDWQILLAPGANVQSVQDELSKSVAPSQVERVGYADVKGFTAKTGGTVQTTGAGKVLGVSATYLSIFPKEVRPLVGPIQGVVLAQQTAANLHAGPGDQVQILRPGLPPATVRVDGVIDLPNADSLFQAVGTPAGAAAQAPPDNVLILPDKLWHQFFDPQAAVRPDSTRTQLHARLGHPLPPDPSGAYTAVTRLKNNFEARIAGNGIVGDNLAARLLSVMEDALYAQVLFLFLGVPGLILVIGLTLSIASAAGSRREMEQALLRVRGADIEQVMRLAVGEALVTAAGGIALGLLLTAALAPFIGLEAGQMGDPRNLEWLVTGSVVGLALALASVSVPAWSHARQVTVVAARAIVKLDTGPLWQRMWLDVIILAIGGLEYWRTASSGYKIVLAPEGVAANSVNFEAFFAPLCAWIGGVLLADRIVGWALRNGRGWLSRILAPIAGGLSGLVGNSVVRQSRLITRGIVYVSLAVSFALSTAVFDTTFNAQSRVDAELTNGSDVTVIGPTANPPGARIGRFRAIPGIVSVQAMQHRMAYVGTDLQDLYGIDAANIGEATHMSNAYFGNFSAQKTLAALTNRPDGVLVSKETVNDFQLNPGDLLNLRLQFPRDHKYHVVPFHYIGIVREFPTAPKDSFLVVNQDYVAQQTGSDAAEILLMRVRGPLFPVVEQARAIVKDIPGAKVSDLGSVQQAISSSLTAIDLNGLTRLELGFAILLVAAATGLVLGLALAERRKMFAILSGIGAKTTQLGAFLWSEALLMVVIGGAIGGALGLGVAEVLVKMLNGVFDPPPEAILIPWPYLLLLILATAISTVAAVFAIQVAVRRKVMETLRGL